MSKPRALSPRMLEALVTVAKTQQHETRNFLPNFRLNTLVGLMSRGYIDTTEKGYVLTLSGEMYLITNGHMVKDHDSDTVIHVTTGYVSVLRKVEMIRNYHLRKALEKFNAVDVELTGEPRIGRVDDTMNNVGRRCNIQNNSDFESRCWEVLSEIVNYGNPTIERLYLVRYVGKEVDYRYENPSDRYMVSTLNMMTNLY